MGAGISQDAASSSQTPKPAVPEVRGTKRGSDQDDEERHYQRADEDGTEEIQWKVFPQPSRTPSPIRSANTEPADVKMDSIHVRGPRCSRPEQKALERFESEGRLRDMANVREKLGCKADVAEVYSPPRIVTVAQAAGLRGGFSLDLTAPSPDGHTWDFSVHSNRVKARQLLE